MKVHPSCFLVAMLRNLVFSGFSITIVQAFAPAPIRWGGLSVSRFFLAPRLVQDGALGPPWILTISDQLGSTLPNGIPHFTARLDNSIAWDAMGLCVEADSKEEGAVVRLNRCTGDSTQKWDWLPSDSRRHNHIQLKDTHMCLDVDDVNSGLNGSPVKLRECEQRVTELWKSEDLIPFATQRSNDGFRHAHHFMRHAMFSCVSIATVVLLSLGSWVWQRQRRARSAAAGPTGATSNVDTGGVCLTGTRGHSSSRHKPPVMVAATADVDVDVAVIGGGPAGYAMAAVLHGSHGHSVALIDPNPDREWPNNYGSWCVEWEELSRRLGMPELMTDCVNKKWKITDCFFGGSWGTEWEQRTRLDKEYLQVNRTSLKAAFCAKLGDGVKILPTSLRTRTIAPNLFEDNLVHDADGSALTLQDGTSVRTKIVIDATGFESSLVARESEMLAGLSRPLPPGFQIAYGFSCDIEGSSIAPYDTTAMTLFDYRTDHFEAAVAGADSPEAEKEAKADLQDAECRPSFMYVMPDGPTENGCTRAFFEETSLVGRGERRLEFSTLKKRALIRLKHLGLSIREGSVHEEEYCYIPMGGNLPDLSQRIVAIGGAAATVHPATGYQLCRMLASTTDVAAALSTCLRSGGSPDAAAAAAYRALWSPQFRLQRDFQVFGGEFLGDRSVSELRGFFDAFFKLDSLQWGGFLAGWPGLPGNEYHDAWYKRLSFGLKLFINLPPQVALALMTYAVSFSLKYGGNLLRSFLTPLFGADGGVIPLDRDELSDRITATYVTGDMEAKREALNMLRAPDGNGEASPQVAAAADT